MPRIAPELFDVSRYVFVYGLQTRFSDMDALQHINNVAIAAAFEDARVRFDEELGAEVLFAGLRVMIVAAYIDYLAEAHYPDPLGIHIAVQQIGRTSWTLAQLATQRDRPRAFCRATLCATLDGRPAPLPEPLRRRLQDKQLRPDL